MTVYVPTTDYFAVPAQNSAANVDVMDVVGNKTDDESGTSLYSLAHINEQHVHGAPSVWPERAAPILLTAAGVGGGWSNGAWVQIIAAGATTAPFDIHWIEISAVSANADYLIEIAAVTTVIAPVKFSRSNPFTASVQRQMQTAIQPAGTQIQARLISSADGGETCRIALTTHPY